jgi:hypothetical protein
MGNVNLDDVAFLENLAFLFCLLWAHPLQNHILSFELMREQKSYQKSQKHLNHSFSISRNSLWGH